MSRSIHPDPPAGPDPPCEVRSGHCNGRCVRLYHNPSTDRVFCACLMCAAALRAAGFVFVRVPPRQDPPESD